MIETGYDDLHSNPLLGQILTRLGDIKFITLVRRLRIQWPSSKEVEYPLFQ